MEYLQKYLIKMRTKYLFIIQIILLLTIKITFGQMIVDQKILLIENSKTLYGNFSVDLQVKCQNSTEARTLGSATIDIVYDSTKLRFMSGSDWNSSISYFNGYTTSIQSNNSESGTNRAIRIVALGTNVNVLGGGNPPGYDLKDVYDTWVRANFIILNTSNPVSLTVKNITNQIGVFENLHNDPRSFVINNQTLSPPINLINIALPVNTGSEMSNDYKISNNYPNPFNPETAFKISVKNTTKFLINVYDISSKLINSESRVFYGNSDCLYDLKMNEYPSGTYFVVFNSNHYSQKFKIVLLK